MNTYNVKALETVDRDVTEVNTPAETFIEIEVTRKEAVDVDDALSHFLEQAINGNYKSSEQVSNFIRLWKGRRLSSPTIMITNSQDADIILDALACHVADELDVTDRLHDALVKILDETSIDL